MIMTCSNLRYALSMISQYYANFDSTHVEAIVQILKYVHGILHYSFNYPKSQPKFGEYTDMD